MDIDLNNMLFRVEDLTLEGMLDEYGISEERRRNFRDLHKQFIGGFIPTRKDLEEKIDEAGLKELCLRLPCKVLMHRWNPVQDFADQFTRQGRIQRWTKDKTKKLLTKAVNRYKDICMYNETDKRIEREREWCERKKENLMRLAVWEYDRKQQEDNRDSQENTAEPQGAEDETLSQLSVESGANVDVNAVCGDAGGLNDTTLQQSHNTNDTNHRTDGNDANTESILPNDGDANTSTTSSDGMENLQQRHNTNNTDHRTDENDTTEANTESLFANRDPQQKTAEQVGQDETLNQLSVESGIRVEAVGDAATGGDAGGINHITLQQVYNTNHRTDGNGDNPEYILPIDDNANTSTISSDRTESLQKSHKTNNTDHRTDENGATDANTKSILPNDDNSNTSTTSSDRFATLIIVEEVQEEEEEMIAFKVYNVDTTEYSSEIANPETATPMLPLSQSSANINLTDVEKTALITPTNSQSVKENTEYLANKEYMEMLNAEVNGDISRPVLGDYVNINSESMELRESQSIFSELTPEYCDFNTHISMTSTQSHELLQ